MCYLSDTWYWLSNASFNKNQAAQDVLLKQLAVENANADCQKVLQSLKNADPNIMDKTKACQDEGTEGTKGPC